MDYFTQIRLKDWAILLLILLNLSMIGLLWRSQQIGGTTEQRRGPKKGHAIETFFREELQFSPEQMEAFHETQKERQRVNSRLRRKGHESRARMFELLGRGASEEQADSLSQQIGQAEAAFELANFQHFRTLREICNEEQQKKFDLMINDVLRKAAPHPGPPGGGPPGRRPPPGHRPGGGAGGPHP